MRTLIAILILATLAMGMQSCGGFRKAREARVVTKAKQQERKAAYAAQKAEEEAAAARAETGSTAEAAPVEIPVLQQDSLLFSLERGACFGRCPVYTIRIYESGYTTYEGKNFVDYMGHYSTRISDVDLANIYSRLAETDFFSLEESYDNPNISDLPSTIYEAHAMGKDKRIVARYDIPQVLIQLGKDVDALFADTQWLPVTE